MKARTLPLVCAVIYGGFDDAEERKIKTAADRCGYRALKAPADSGGASVKSVLGAKPDTLGEPLCDERFIVINGGGANAARLMDILKAESVEIELRAMVTLHNQDWPLNALIKELREEHNRLTEGAAD